MFPGASADREHADYAVVGAPLDRSATGRPGARYGPPRMREAAASFEDYDHRTGQTFSDCAVADHGDVGAGGDVGEYLEFLTSTVRATARNGAVPVVLGGEHTVTRAGVRATEPDVYVTCDAHLDLRSSYAGDPDSHATVAHHALETADRAVVLGARSGSEREYERAASGPVELVPPGEVGAWLGRRNPTDDGSADGQDDDPGGLAGLAGERVYLSIDVDAADPSVAPATGTPEPGGLDARTLLDVVRAVAPEAVGFDVVEVTDHDAGQTAALGAKAVRAFVYAHAASH